MATNRTNTKIAKTIATEVKGDIAMTIAKEIVKKNIANATMKGETTMNNNSTPMTAVITTNNALAGYEIRFSVAPSEIFRARLGMPAKGEDKRRKHYGFRYYGKLGNAWIIKQSKITDKSLNALKKEIAKLGYEITEDTVEPKAKKTASKKPTAKKESAPKTATIPKEADLVEYLTKLGYVIELPEAKAEDKPKKARKPRAKKAEAEIKAKAEPKAKSESKAKAKKPSTKKKTAKAESVTVTDAEMPF